MFVIKRNQIIISALVVMIAVAGYLNYADNGKDEISGFVYSEEGDISALVPDGSSLNSAVTVNAQGNEAVSLENLTNADVISDDIGIALTPDGGNDTSSQANITEPPVESPSTPSETPESNTTGDSDSSNQSTEPGEALFVNATVDSTYFVQVKLDREQSRSKQRELLLEMINNQNLEQDKKAECADAMLDIQKRIEKESAAEAMIEAKGFKEVFVRIDDNTVDVVVSKEVLSDAEIAQIEDIIKRKTGFESSNIRISPMSK